MLGERYCDMCGYVGNHDPECLVGQQSNEPVKAPESSSEALDLENLPVRALVCFVASHALSRAAKRLRNTALRLQTLKNGDP